jgi:hypothetical protein
LAELGQRTGLSSIMPSSASLAVPGRAISPRPLLSSTLKRDRRCTGLLVALAGLRLLDPQVAQRPVKRLLVGVVLLPAGEVIEAVAKPAGQLQAHGAALRGAAEKRQRSTNSSSEPNHGC